jgi:WD40 repeat protein/tRNA A-37 threonylcarbamoyl transferase component Bud32
MNTAAEPGTCRKCGQPLGGLAPEGVCARCLLLTGLDETNGGTALEPGSQGRESRSDFDLPRSFGNYELLEEIARGGMGVVYKARQLGLDRFVAIKMLLLGRYTSQEFIHRFRIEAAAAASLRHPNIVAIHEVGVHQGQHYFAMDLVDGPNLAQFIGQKPLPAKRAATYVKTIAEAIQFAHEHHILHRDLKPSNILIDSNDQPRITDFGLAKRLTDSSVSTPGSPITLTGQMLGSPNYMPPEQASFQRGRIGPHSDVYSIGAILYHALTGRPPFMGETLADTLQQVLNNEPIRPRLLNPAVPADLETICLKCLEREPTQRYATARELADELGRFQRDEPIRSRPVNAPERAWRWCRRKPAVAALLLGLLVVGVLGLAGILWQWRRAAQDLYVANVYRANEALETDDEARAQSYLRGIENSSVQQGMRGWEWRYVAGRVRGDQATILDKPAANVWSIAASSDGQWLAAIHGDGRVKLWDFNSGRETNSWLAHGPPADSGVDADRHALFFVHDGKTLVTVGPDKRMCSWEIPNGRKLAEMNVSAVPYKHALGLSRDGRMFAAGKADGKFELYSLSSNPPTQLSAWPCRFSVLLHLEFSPDGLTLFAGGPTAQLVRRYDISDPTQPHPLPALEDSDGPLAISPDGQWLATAGAYGQPLRVWALPSLAPVGTNFVRRSRLSSLAFSRDSQVIAAGLEDGQIILWDRNSPEEQITLLGHERQVMSLAFSADGRKLASASLDRTVRLWDTKVGERGKWVFHAYGSANDVHFSSNSQYLASVSQSTLGAGTNEPQRVCVTQLWDVDEHQGLTLRASQTNQAFELNSHISFSPDSSIVAEDDYSGMRFLRVPSLELSARLGERLPCWPANGRWLAYVQGNKIYRSDFPVLSPSVLVKTHGLQALALSRDGRLLASAGDARDWSIQLWDARDGRRLKPALAGHQAWVSCLAFSPDGKTLASAGWDDGWLGIWDVPKRRRRAMLRGSNGSVYEVAFSPDGATLATCGSDETVRLWSVTRLQEVAALRGHRGPVNGVAFSPDGHWLASASSDGTIRLWHAPSFEELALLPKSDRESIMP